MKLNDLSELIIGSAIEVHNALGPGLLESAYIECLSYEIAHSGLLVERQKMLPIVYKGITVDHGYRMDLLVERTVVIEVKTVDMLKGIHSAQLLTYLKLGEYKLGLLLNFNVSLLRHGIKRIIN